MKRKIVLLMALFALLTACGKQPEREGIADPVPEASAMEEKAPVEQLSLKLMYGEGNSEEPRHYSPERKTFVALVENGSDTETVNFGTDYRIQRKTAQGWEDLPRKEDVVAADIFCEVGPGVRRKVNFDFSPFQEAGRSGETYRLVKETSAQTLYGEFVLDEQCGEKLPYGFVPLEELPENYGSANAEKDVILLSDHGEKRLEQLGDFLDLVLSGCPCQLRILQEYNEGHPMLIDVIYEDDHFCWQMRMDGVVDKKYFSYVVTDGQSICLSCSADWDQAWEGIGRDTVYLLPEGIALPEDALRAAKESMVWNETQSGIRYQCWSPEGTYSAGWGEDQTELYVNGQERSAAFPVTDKSGKPTEITDLIWESEDTLLVYTKNGARVFSPLDWKLYG